MLIVVYVKNFISRKISKVNITENSTGNGYVVQGCTQRNISGTYLRKMVYTY